VKRGYKRMTIVVPTLIRDHIANAAKARKMTAGRYITNCMLHHSPDPILLARERP
jgi:hypothetical protein